MPHEWFKDPKVQIALGLSALLFLTACADIEPIETEAAPAPDPSPEPAGARTEKVCPKSTYFESLSLSRPVETPDIRLGSGTGLEALKNSDGWFVINQGTALKPDYQLARMYPDGTVKLGQKVPDLSLLGPSSIPEVSRTDPGLRGSATGVAEEEMRAFYQYPKPPNWQLPLGFQDGLERRISTFDKPVIVGGRPVSDADVIKLRNTVFDSVDFSKQPTGPDSCKKPYYATVTFEFKEYGKSLVTNEYPMLRESDPKTQSWVRAHELGHALSRITDAPTAFNALPSEERARLLSELKQLHEALQVDRKLRSYDTADEIVGDLYAYMLKDPAYVEKHAPKTAAFFRDLIKMDPQLSKIITFPPDSPRPK